MLANFTAVQDQPVYPVEINMALDIVSSLNKYVGLSSFVILLLILYLSVTSTVVNKLSPTDMLFEVKKLQGTGGCLEFINKYMYIMNS